MILPRGEAIRNFLYSDTLTHLSQHADVTLLSVVGGSIVDRLRSGPEQLLELTYYAPHPAVAHLRGLIDLAHFRWLSSEVARETLKRRVTEAPDYATGVKRRIVNALTALAANRPSLELLDSIERRVSWKLRPTDYFAQLFRELRPSVVFNGSHIHGPAAEEPLRAAHHLGIPTAGFIFSWDNLTSRGRILAPYDYFFVWNKGMKDQLLRLYPRIRAGTRIRRRYAAVRFPFSS